MRMVFLVVQWEGENSFSTISESKVVLTDQSAEEDLKEGMTVQVLVGKTSKGKSTLYQATVLKIFASQSKALAYEKSLTTKPAENDDDLGGFNSFEKLVDLT
ncbi:uncharacterized protein LOC122950167 [Acropora millepora]|uniref:uncharacterized protein LOC122950167 n=1 Tax=Acropora millepora TaxID=45264 RepID=UPI001CF46C02|nr:uncharacterized protein LOC122950167 [Acropora millepora]